MEEVELMRGEELLVDGVQSEEVAADEAFFDVVNDDLPVEDLPLLARVSSLLFVSPRPLSIDTIAQATDATHEDVEVILAELANIYREEYHGFSLHQVGESYELRSSPKAASTIRRLIPARAKRLSRAAAETLAVIAYKQPVQRSEIEAIRGVDALPTLKTLLDAALIRVVGRDNSVGQPALYGTTTRFLERFGLRDLSELPTVRELSQLAAEPGEAVSEEANVDGTEDSEKEVFAGDGENENADAEAA